MILGDIVDEAVDDGGEVGGRRCDLMGACEGVCFLCQADGGAGALLFVSTRLRCVGSF